MEDDARKRGDHPDLGGSSSPRTGLRAGLALTFFFSHQLRQIDDRAVKKSDVEKCVMDDRLGDCAPQRRGCPPQKYGDFGPS
jgi:hypothetical protein